CPTDNGAVRPEGRAPAHESRTQLLHASDFAARIEDVGEHHRRPAKHAVFEGHPLVHRHVVLDLDAVADRDIGANDVVLSDTAVLAYPGALEDVAHVPDRCPLTNLPTLVDEGRFVSEERPRVGGRSRHRPAAMLEGFLALLQDSENTETFLAVGARSATCPEALEEVATLGPKRLLRLDRHGLDLGPVG